MAGMTPQDSADAAQQAADAARVAAEQAQVLADHARLLAEQASYSGGADPLVFQISIFVMAVLLGACTVLAGRGGELRSIGAGAMLALAVTAAGGHCGGCAGRQRADSRAGSRCRGAQWCGGRGDGAGDAGQGLWRRVRAMSVVSLSILAYALSGVLLALGLLPFWRDGGSRVDMRLLLAGVAAAVLSALFVFGDASTTRLLAIVAALGGGAVAGGLAVLRRNSRDAGELVPAAVAAIGAGVVLLAAAAFMTPDGLVSVRDGAIRARDLLMLALSAGLGAFCCSGGVVVALRKAGMTGGKLGPKVPVGMATGPGCAECLAGLDAVCVQPAGRIVLVCDRDRSECWPDAVSAGRRRHG
jgi:hypothetical protein